MIWQDAILMVGSFVLGLLLIPIIMNEESKVPRMTSVPTGSVLLLFSYVYFTLGLWFSSATVLLTGLLWMFIAIKRADN